MYMCEDMQLNMDALVVVGGVAANQDLRQRLQELAASVGEWRAVFPPPELCTDNGVMCAWAGVEKLLRGLSDPLDGEVRAKWPLGMLLTPAFDT
jgi:N6-L-threonylcarbamoyladenine synthase